MDEKQEILTREEVMDILKIGRSTFYKLMQEVPNGMANT